MTAVVPVVVDGASVLPPDPDEATAGAVGAGVEVRESGARPTGAVLRAGVEAAMVRGGGAAAATTGAAAGGGSAAGVAAPVRAGFSGGAAGAGAIDGGGGGGVAVAAVVTAVPGASAGGAVDVVEVVLVATDRAEWPSA